MKIILASASPRRKALLKVLGLDFEVIVSDCEEIIDNTESVSDIVKSLSLQKALSVCKMIKDDSIIISADTVVAIGNNILGKPKDFDDAKNMLKMLSGNTHKVYTGYTIIRTTDNLTITDYEATSVTFKTLTETEIVDYITNNPPYDKAGAYSIQGTASSFVEAFDGDYNNIVGLPLYMLSKYLYNTFGIENI